MRVEKEEKNTARGEHARVEVATGCAIAFNSGLAGGSHAKQMLLSFCSVLAGTTHWLKDLEPSNGLHIERHGRKNHHVPL